jgi:GNAT superfamily N-acetyltransferase
MNDYVIRLLTSADLEDAMRLSSTAGWNQRLEDWRMLLELAPAATFAAFSQERVVGTAIGIDYGRFSWIAMMLVDPAWRGRGIGRRLLETAMDAVPADRPIRLDATPMGRPLYQSCGFEDEALLTRQVAEPAQRTVPPAPPDAPMVVRPMTPQDLGAVAGQDRLVFGGHRRAVLEWSCGSASEYCHIRDTDVGVAQYCLGRRGRLFDQVGPVVAADRCRGLCAGALRRSLAQRGNRARRSSTRTTSERRVRVVAAGVRVSWPSGQLFRMRRAPSAAGGPLCGFERESRTRCEPHSGGAHGAPARSGAGRWAPASDEPGVPSALCALGWEPGSGTEHRASAEDEGPAGLSSSPSSVPSSREAVPATAPYSALPPRSRRETRRPPSAPRSP